jgi:Aspartyl/Asparaginyl beta-hydroxylase
VADGAALRNFLKLADGIIVNPLLLQIKRHTELWDSTHIAEHWKKHHPEIDVSEILIRYPDGDESDDIQCVWKPSSAQIPLAREVALNVMAHVRGEQLGRVVLTRLPPGKVIYPHADTVGLYTKFYTRFHVPVQSDENVKFTCGDEAVAMRSGELWWFDYAVLHNVENRSNADRINLIIDVRLS